MFTFQRSNKESALSRGFGLSDIIRIKGDLNSDFSFLVEGPESALREDQSSLTLSVWVREDWDSACKLRFLWGHSYG